MLPQSGVTHFRFGRPRPEEQIVDVSIRALEGAMIATLLVSGCAPPHAIDLGGDQASPWPEQSRRGAGRGIAESLLRENTSALDVPTTHRVLGKCAHG